MKKETENWEKDFIGLENMLICLAQEQDNAISCGDKELSQKLWKEQMGEIRSFINQLLISEKESWQRELIEKIEKLVEKIDRPEHPAIPSDSEVPYGKRYEWGFVRGEHWAKIKILTDIREIKEELITKQK